MKTKIVADVFIGAMCGLAVAWLAGYNFDTRGLPAIMTLLVSIVGAVFGAVFAVLEDE